MENKTTLIDRLNEQTQPKLTKIKCPITDDWLVLEPKTRPTVMDGSSFYFAENHPEYRYERHPFSFDIFRQVYGGNRTIGSKALSYWRIDEDNSWCQMMEVDVLDVFLPINTPQEEIDLLIKQHKKKQKGDFIDLFSKKCMVFKPYTEYLGLDLVPEQALSEPKGEILWFTINQKINNNIHML